MGVSKCDVTSQGEIGNAGAIFGALVGAGMRRTVEPMTWDGVVALRTNKMPLLSVVRFYDTRISFSSPTPGIWHTYD